MATLKEALAKQGIYVSPKPGRSKYGAVRTEIDGHKFASKKEARAYQTLKALQNSGTIKGFVMQVPLGLGFPNDKGREYRYVCDFLITNVDGSHRWVEVKGLDLQMGRLKRHCAEAKYGIKVEVI